MRRSGFGSQLRPTANARSRLVYVFHRAEKKLRGSFGSYSSNDSTRDAQPHRWQVQALTGTMSYTFQIVEVCTHLL